MILIEAISLAIEMSITDFAGKTSWCERFMKRNDLCVLNETNGCNNVENIYFFLELCQHVSGIIMPIIRIQMW
jgi:hypothetical protein